MVFETYVSTNIRLQTYVYTNQVCEVSGNISDHVLVFRVFDIYIDDMYKYDIYIYIYISILLDRFQKSFTRFLYVLNIKPSLLSSNAGYGSNDKKRARAIGVALAVYACVLNPDMQSMEHLTRMKIYLRHEFFPLLRLPLLLGCRKAVSRSATFVGRRARKEDARDDPTNNHAYTLEEMLDPLWEFGVHVAKSLSDEEVASLSFYLAPLRTMTIMYTPSKVFANLLLCECGRDALQNFGASIITVVGNPNPPVARKSLGCGKHYNRFPFRGKE